MTCMAAVACMVILHIDHIEVLKGSEQHVYKFRFQGRDKRTSPHQIAARHSQAHLHQSAHHKVTSSLPSLFRQHKHVFVLPLL